MFCQVVVARHVHRKIIDDMEREEKGRVYTKYKCPGKNCHLVAAPVYARLLFSSAESAVGLSSKELGQLARGIHHNAVGIAIRRFTQRLQSDRTLLEKVSFVQRN
jgi:hypothetical protein